MLLCLCSKNDAGDVDELFRSHPDMVLRDEHFVAKRVNWDDKVDNLRASPPSSDIGLDAIVFVDDSAFECEAVRSRLPDGETLQVPRICRSTRVIVERLKRLFVRAERSTDGASKTAAVPRKVEAARGSVGGREPGGYLASLDMRVTIRANDERVRREDRRAHPEVEPIQPDDPPIYLGQIER